MKIEPFYNHLLVQDGLQKITIEGYKKVLTKYFKENKHFDRKTVEAYIARMRQRDYSYSHVANTSVALERLSNYLGKPIKLGRPRKPKQLIKNTLTEGEIARMLAICKNSRERALLSVLVYTGLRNKELCQLKTEDVDIGNQCVRVVEGKGSKDRVVYFTSECGQMLTEYKSEYKPNGIMFTTLALHDPYNGWALRKMVKIVAKRAGVKKRVYPHLFRHSLACNLLNRGANIMTIQSLLGHSDIRTTMIYAKSSPQRVKQEYLFYNPSYL